MAERKYAWSFAELCDRLSIVIMKIAHAESKEMADSFRNERNDILHDIDLFIQEGVKVDSRMICYIQNLQFINTKIWENETAQRGETVDSDAGWKEKYEKLIQSHKWNADRANCKKAIQTEIGGRVDHKLNYIDGGFNL